jgi:hypothetical protein
MVNSVNGKHAMSAETFSSGSRPHKRARNCSATSTETPRDQQPFAANFQATHNRGNSARGIETTHNGEQSAANIARAHDEEQSATNIESAHDGEHRWPTFIETVLEAFMLYRLQMQICQATCQMGQERNLEGRPEPLGYHNALCNISETALKTAKVAGWC